MKQQEMVPGRMNRDRVAVLLGLVVTTAALLLAMLLVGLATAHAGGSHVAAGIRQDERFAGQDGPVMGAEWRPTAAITLLIGTNAEYWPMEYISGTEIVGHDIDLMNAIGAEMSVTIVYTNVAWDGILDGLMAGEYDAVISALTVLPDREELIDFTLPYVTLGEVDDLAIAVQEGDDLLRQQINEALRQLRADGTLESIVAAIAADVPEWEPRLPDWPVVFLPLVVTGPGE